MTTFAISDLHGYPVDKFKALLDKAGFSDTDTLYVLGDVIDRNGDGGVSLLRYIMAQPNFEFILGKRYGKTVVFAVNRFNAIALDSIFKSVGVKSDYVISGLLDESGRFSASSENPQKINAFR